LPNTTGQKVWAKAIFVYVVDSLVSICTGWVEKTTPAWAGIHANQILN
jgi:hypothetical protein